LTSQSGRVLHIIQRFHILNCLSLTELPAQRFIMSVDETYTLAHTAQCKLKIAADKPDRNLRFILGHAFTFDKLMCRIVEIENDQESMPKHGHQEPTERRVSFKDNSNRPTGPLRQEVKPSTNKGAQGARSPSPPPDLNVAHLDDSSDSSDSDDYVFEDDEDADNPSLSLSRTTSNIPRPPPNLVPSDGDSSDEDDGPESPPTRPSDAVLETITEEEGDEMLAELYENVRKCGCQRDVEKQAPAVSKVWELPQAEAKKHGKGMKQMRTLVVQVQA
jgi:hypothetical protein